MKPTDSRRAVVVLQGAGSEASRLSAELYPGEGFALCGADESKRTLTLSWITGEQIPSVGRVRILGARPGGPEAKSVLSSITPRLRLNPNFTAGETLHLFGKLSGVPSVSKAVEEMLVRFEAQIIRHRLVGSLDEPSRRLLVVMAGLIRPSKILCLDSPESMVHGTQVFSLVEVLSERLNGGTVLVLSTRDQAFVPLISRMFSFGPHGVKAAGRPDNSLL